MDPNETMVDEELDIEETDQFPEDIVEEEDESEENLEEYIDDSPEEEEPAEEPEPPAKEPGYVKQRIEKAVQKALAEKDAEFQAMLEKRMAPLMEKLIESEAQELVRSRKIADIETAREYVKLKQGMPSKEPEKAPEKAPEQPRNEKGQFTARDEALSARHEARIEMLRHQADRIKASGGPDVIAEFMSNEDVKKAVVAGDMDFYDLAKQMQAPRKRPPSPTRSPNGASSVNRSIESMTDEQFHKMDEMLDQGVRFTYRR